MGKLINRLRWWLAWRFLPEPESGQGEGDGRVTYTWKLL